MTRLCAFAAELLFVFAILSSPLAGHAASFDWTKVASPVEKLICAEEELSRLDDELAAAYRAASGAPGAADQVRRDQRQWLAVRDVCRDRACIKAAYDRRLADLRAARGCRPLVIFDTLRLSQITRGAAQLAPRYAAQTGARRGINGFGR